MEFFAGCAGGVAGVVVGHPLDTVKVKLQTQSLKNPMYKGTWDCISKSVKQNGVKSLYRGMTSPMAGVSAVNAVIFGVHGNVTKTFKDPNALTTHLIAGASAGLVQSFIVSPVELAKTRIQLQNANSPYRYKGPLDFMTRIYGEEGLRGVFRGQGITIAREVPAFSAYFFTYEYLARKINTNENGTKSKFSVLFAGGMAGVSSWVVSYPMDVIKSRLQMDGIGGQNKYHGILDCVRQSVKRDGLSVLTRGLSTTVIRAFPTNAATFFVVDGICQLNNMYSGETDSTKTELLEKIAMSSEHIIEGAKIENTRVGNSIGYANSNVIQNTKSFIRKSENVTSEALSSVVRNYCFYDSYCNKMSLFNSTQILGISTIF